jgi:hypothetical protein
VRANFGAWREANVSTNSGGGPLVAEPINTTVSPLSTAFTVALPEAMLFIGTYNVTIQSNVSFRNTEMEMAIW